MKLVGYVRVSLDAPVTDVVGADEQRDAIRAWALGVGAEVVATLIDEGPTAGTELGARLALGDALEMTHEGKAEGIVVARLERLSSDVITQELLRADLLHVGASLRSAIPAEDAALVAVPEDPDRARVRAIIEAIPEYRTAIRDLRVRARRALYGERDRSILSRIEALAERGSALSDISAGLGRAAARPRFGETFDVDAFRRFVARAKRARKSR